MPQYPWERPTMDSFLQEAANRYSSIFNLSAQEITAAIQSACAFFGMPYPQFVLDLTKEGGQTMFCNYDASSYQDDVICYNLRQLQSLGANNQVALSLIMTHECAHRFFQRSTFLGANNGAWEEELTCDYFMGVRAAMQQLDIQNVAFGLAETSGAKSHPDGDLRFNAIMYGTRIVMRYKVMGVPLTMDSFIDGARSLLGKLSPTIYERQQRYM